MCSFSIQNVFPQRARDHATDPFRGEIFFRPTPFGGEGFWGRPISEEKAFGSDPFRRESLRGPTRSKKNMCSATTKET